MPRENVNISKEGISATLVSYLSEYSISLVVLAYMATSYYLPVFNHPLSSVLKIHVSIEMKIAICLLLVMLLHPIGSLITILSWAFLGWTEKIVETFHFGHRTFLTTGIKDYLNFEQVRTKMNLTSANFYDTAREKEHLLEVKYPDQIATIDFALGNSVFVRNLLFVALSLSIIHFVNCQWHWGFCLIIISMLLCILNSIAAFYYSLYVLVLSNEVV